MKRFLPLLFLPLAALAVDYPTVGQVERLDPALDALIPKDAKIEKLAEGFTWAEGPVWKDGALLFSDVPENIVYQWKRFNSPNDLAIRRNGEIYFTDPPYGLEGLDKSPIKELAFHGVYRLQK